MYDSRWVLDKAADFSEHSKLEISHFRHSLLFEVATFRTTVLWKAISKLNAALDLNLQFYPSLVRSSKALATQ